MSADAQGRSEIAALVDRLKAVLAAPPGHHVFSTTVDADLLREAIDELERLRAEVAELRRTHPRLATTRVRVSPSPFEEDYWT